MGAAESSPLLGGDAGERAGGWRGSGLEGGGKRAGGGLYAAGE